MRHYRFLILSAALFFSSSLFAQQKNYSGTVLDSNGEPIIGATVKKYQVRLQGSSLIWMDISPYQSTLVQNWKYLTSA